MSETKLTWPERLVLRDTKVFADEGQRIFSTATGYGYEKQEYIRADAVDAIVTALRDLCDAWDDKFDGGRFRGNVTNAHAAARAALSRATGGE